MGAPTPQVLLEAIANAADPGNLPGDKTFPLPDAPTGTNAASIQGGFPQVTMESELSGGEPPLGQDMNGFLYLVSSHTLWVECGQLYLFDADLATAIGGYLAGTMLGMADGTGSWLCVSGPNSNDPDAGGAGWVPGVAYGNTVVAGLTGGTTTLTPAQTKYNVLILEGILVSNQIVNLPETLQEWLIINRTSGNFSLTVQTAASGSVGVVVAQGGFGAPIGVYSVGDGNIYPTVAPLNAPIDQNPTPSTIVERTNTGEILATFFNGSSGYQNPSTDTFNGFIGLGGDQATFLKWRTTDVEAAMLLQGIAGQLVNGQVPFSVISQWASTLFTNPAFTGVPTAPTAPPGTSNTQIATTQFASPTTVVNGNGTCITFPNGYKLQFGVANPNGGTVTVTYPVAFTSASFPVPVNISGGPTQAWLPAAPGLANFRLANSGGSSIWIAVGL